MELKNKNMAYQITLIVGLILLSISIFLSYQAIEFIKHSEKVNGKVIELEKIYRTGNTKPSYKPVFEFITKSGEKIIFRSISSSNPPAWKVDETAIYAYKNEKPNDGKVVTFYGIFGWAIALACLAMPLLIIAGGFFATQTYFDNILNSM